VNIPLRRYWGLLVTYLRTQRIKVVSLATLLAGSIALQLANPLIMRAFIDTATQGGALEHLTLLAVAFFVLALVQQVVTVLATYMGEDVGWTATNLLRYDLAKHCLKLDLGFHNARTPGVLIERVDGDVTTLSNFFSQFVVQLLGNGLLLFGILVLMLVEDWRVGLSLALFVLVTLLALGRVRNIAVPHWKAARQARADLYGFLEERLGGTEEIRANGAQAYVMRRFLGLNQVVGRKELFAGLMASTMVNTAWVMFAIGNAVAFIVSAALYQQAALTIGTVYLIFHYTNMLNRPIERIMEQMQDLQRAAASITRVEELMHTEGTIHDGPGVQLPAGPLAVEFAHVSFGYDDARWATYTQEADTGQPETRGEHNITNEDQQVELVLHNIAFALKPGTVLGVLGRTGSGKTTLTRLLLRLYDPTTGVIRLGGVDHRESRLGDLRRRIGVVTQNVQLFHATVRDNLTFFDRSIDDERIVTVLRELGLEAWYNSLPNGLDTKLATGGGGLSAGEAQLLAFTRIFLQDPGLVILDEASSRLDPATEHLIERAVDKLVRDRTAIIIAHRLGTVQRTDEIMILDHGRIVEHDTRKRLAHDPTSRFYRLLQTGLEEVLV
jgi:ATP-binding cassette subfamily B protein